MTKEEAKKYLEKYLLRDIELTNKVTLPVSDVLILTREHVDVDGSFSISQYSFKGLLKIAYDLQDAKEV